MHTMKQNRTTATVYYDARNPGWVLRHTDYDDDGEAVLGRIAMDEQLIDASTQQEAMEQARRFFGSRAAEIIWEL